MPSLHVVIEGAICLVEFSDAYVAYVVKTDGHRMAAGHWLCETALPPGVLKLSVPGSTGSASLDPVSNVIVNEPVLDPAKVAKYSYCQIRLPKPDKVTSYWTSNAPPFSMGGTSLKTVAGQPLSYSAMQVFEYTTGSLADAVLTSGTSPFWAAVPFTAGGDDVDVLHIFSAPETISGDPAHHVKEFNKGAELLGSGLKVKKTPFTFATLTNIPGSPELPMPPGLLAMEVTLVSKREKCVRPIVQAVQTGVLAPVENPSGAGPHTGDYYCGSPNASSSKAAPIA